VLRADVFRPSGEGRCPVILSYGPLRQRARFSQDGYPERPGSAWWPSIPTSRTGSSNKYQSWEVVDPEKWVPEGYACVRVDSRGAGALAGLHRPVLRRARTRDFYDCIEWAGQQPWSNGRVGLNGISYYGINQWHVASLQPPHLAAMCVWEGAADWYRDMTPPTAASSAPSGRNWYDMQVKTVQHGPGRARGARRPRQRRARMRRRATLSDRELQKNRCDFRRRDPRAPRSTTPITGRASPVWEKDRGAVPVGGQLGRPGPCIRAATSRASWRAASKDKWLEAHGIEHWTHFLHGLRQKSSSCGFFSISS